MHEVHFYATLRKISGTKTVELECPDEVTIQELLDAAIARYPGMAELLLDEDGRLFPHAHIFINGNSARYLEQAWDTLVSAGDKIDIFPAVGGG